jgi:uncharacterized membrane protein YfbV (UPF0208 family)
MGVQPALLTAGAPGRLPIRGLSWLGVLVTTSLSPVIAGDEEEAAQPEAKHVWLSMCERELGVWLA